MILAAVVESGGAAKLNSLLRMRVDSVSIAAQRAALQGATPLLAEVKRP
jgi:hypothetical protein